MPPQPKAVIVVQSGIGGSFMGGRVSGATRAEIKVALDEIFTEEGYPEVDTMKVAAYIYESVLFGLDDFVIYGTYEPEELEQLVSTDELWGRVWQPESEGGSGGGGIQWWDPDVVTEEAEEREFVPDIPGEEPWCGCEGYDRSGRHIDDGDGGDTCHDDIFYENEAGRVRIAQVRSAITILSNPERLTVPPGIALWAHCTESSFKMTFALGANANHGDGGRVSRPHSR